MDPLYLALGMLCWAVAVSKHIWERWTEHGLVGLSFLSLALVLGGSGAMARAGWPHHDLVLLMLLPGGLAGWALWAKLSALLHTKWRLPRL